MKATDLDALRMHWTEEGRRIDKALTLDTDAVRSALSGRVTVAFRRHARWLLITLVFDMAAVVALSAFVVGHVGQWVWFALGLPLLPLPVAVLTVDLRQWLTLRRLQMDGPVLQVRATLDALRRRRVRLAKWVFLCSILLWWPLVFVAFKGVLGVDLLPWIHPSVWWVNTGLGLAFIVLGESIARWLARRFGHTPEFRDFLEELGGRSWQESVERFEAFERFEHAGIAEGELDAVLDLEVPVELAPAVGSLRRRLLAGIVACAALIVSLGLFQASHGGEAALIVSGALLNLAVVAHMVAQVIHRSALGRKPAGARALSDRLLAMAAMRQRIAAMTLVLAPILAWPLAMLLGHAGFGSDLTAVVHWPAQLVVVAALLGCSAALSRRYRRHPEGFAPRLVELLCMGTLSRTREILTQLIE